MRDKQRMKGMINLVKEGRKRNTQMSKIKTAYKRHIGPFARWFWGHPKLATGVCLLQKFPGWLVQMDQRRSGSLLVLDDAHVRLQVIQ